VVGERLLGRFHVDEMADEHTLRVAVVIARSLHTLVVGSFSLAFAARIYGSASGYICLLVAGRSRWT